MLCSFFNNSNRITTLHENQIKLERLKKATVNAAITIKTLDTKRNKLKSTLTQHKDELIDLNKTLKSQKKVKAKTKSNGIEKLEKKLKYLGKQENEYIIQSINASWNKKFYKFNILVLAAVLSLLIILNVIR